MENESITVNVVVDDKIFHRFAVFDNLRRRRIWVLPVIFAAIMSASAFVCFAMRGRAEQAAMIGWVLLIIGLGLPTAYIGLFFKSIKIQIKAMGLETPCPVYTVRLSRAGGISAEIGSDVLRYGWNDLFWAYRVLGCTYLYVEKNKAFLLPDGQAEEGLDVWTLLADILPAEKLRDLT